MGYKNIFYTWCVLLCMMQLELVVVLKDGMIRQDQFLLSENGIIWSVIKKVNKKLSQQPL
jgi:hypothetical protein